MDGLYKGVGSKLVQSVLTAAILFAGQRRIYELTKAVRMHVQPRSVLMISKLGTETCYNEINYCSGYFYVTD